MSFFFMYELMLATVISMEIFPFCFPFILPSRVKGILRTHILHLERMAE